MRCWRDIPSLARRAFTLVELLVVIGIIAILIGVLIPVLSAARESSRSAACLANLQQLGQGILMYVHDHDGQMLPACTINPGSIFWCDALVYFGYVKAPTWHPPNKDATSEQADMLTAHISRSPFTCPSQTNHNINSLFPFSNTYTKKDPVLRCFMRHWLVETSYGINACSQTGFANADLSLKFPFRHLPWVDGAGKYTDFRHPKLTQFRQSSDTALICDGYHYIGTSPHLISARHAKQTRTNFLFADGRAASIESKSLPVYPGDVMDLTRVGQFKPVVWRMDQR